MSQGPSTPPAPIDDTGNVQTGLSKDGFYAQPQVALADAVTVNLLKEILAELREIKART